MQGLADSRYVQTPKLLSRPAMLDLCIAEGHCLAQVVAGDWFNNIGDAVGTSDGNSTAEGIGGMVRLSLKAWSHSAQHKTQSFAIPLGTLGALFAN